MMSIDPPYEIPLLTTGTLLHGGIRRQGSLMELLGFYEGLSASQREKASLLLDQRIMLPVPLGSGSRGSRLNLFDGEVAVLLPYYRAAMAAARTS